MKFQEFPKHSNIIPELCANSQQEVIIQLPTDDVYDGSFIIHVLSTTSCLIFPYS